MPLLAPIVQAPTTPTQPPAKVDLFKGMRLFWTGWDGTTWDLTGNDSGVRVLADGIRGLGVPNAKDWTSESPNLPGRFYRGYRATEREVHWIAFVYSDVSSAQWLEYDRAFWRSMRLGKFGTLTAQTPNGKQRTLDLHRNPEMTDEYARDPVKVGWCAYPIDQIAERPYWQGEIVRRSFISEDPVAFFGAEHDPVPDDDLLFISSGNTLANATITNPGDVDSSPIFVLDGPWDSGASVGVGSNLTTYGAAVADGTSIVIDTRPDKYGAKQITTPTATPGSPEWMDAIEAEGTDKFTSLSALALDLTIPAEETVDLEISATGNGSVHVVLPSLYERAW